MTTGLVERARAKVNLFLLVTGRRPDGYHLLDSLTVFAAIGDELRASPADDLDVRIEGRFAAELPANEDNLVHRAARDLARWAGIPARAQLVLRKELPIASGIGGGSADAAATLRVLHRLWNLPATTAELHELALGLGADVPVCLFGRPARMTGIGEVLSPAPRLPPFGIVLVNPGVAVPTPAVFRIRQGGFSPPACLPDGWPDAAAMAQDLRGIGNDLTDAAVALQPVIGQVLTMLQGLPGCLLARMSGSGATCFGLFADAPEAASIAARMERPAHWWCWGGALEG
jgi:4-diphosphocytidyl-2-C-methyl-D-erythritol kinase